jgi:hypothetical protein
VAAALSTDGQSPFFVVWLKENMMFKRFATTALLLGLMIPAAQAQVTMDAAKQKRLLDMMPELEDKELALRLQDPQLIVYTRAEMPQAHQDWRNSYGGGFQSIDTTRTAARFNRSFPWGRPGGTHRTEGVTTFKFISLPKDDGGKARPIIYFRKRMPSDRKAGYGWLFPVDTVIGEVLAFDRGGGKLIPFEIRTRTRELDNWGVNVYRPFPTAKSLADAIQQKQPDWTSDTQLVKLMRHLTLSSTTADKLERQAEQMVASIQREDPQWSKDEGKVRLVSMLTAKTTQTKTLASKVKSGAFAATARVDELPPIGDDALAERLLTEQTFAESLSNAWRTGGDTDAVFVPSASEGGLHVVPARYDGAFMGNSREDCMRCHADTAKMVKDDKTGRLWKVRGFDGIFSFNPVAPSSISRSGGSRSVRMRSDLTRAGLLVQYVKSQHTREHYRPINALYPTRE